MLVFLKILKIIMVKRNWTNREFPKEVGGGEILELGIS